MNESIRKLDGLGRIVIPKDYRKKLKISDDSKLKISLENDYVKIEKYSDINTNLKELLKLKKILKKQLDLEILITDLDQIIDEEIILPKDIIEKIRYGKIEIVNGMIDNIYNSNKNINIIINPIILYGEVNGAIIGYSYKREIDDLDKKILDIAISIFIKDIED